ncbi:MAG: methylenetetrahydrofolate reductase C-terminal domain-containing protein [bacterium]
MCGQCILRTTALTCPMRCPKKMRNGPCGGTRVDGNCEVHPERRCIWMTIYDRARRLGWSSRLGKINPPIDQSLMGTSSWVNLLIGRIDISGVALSNRRAERSRGE